MQRRLVHALVAVAASSCLLASTAGAASLGDAKAVDQPLARQATLQGSCPSGVGLDAPLAIQESAMLCLIGEARGQNSLSPLASSETLKQTAVEKGADLLQCKEFSHTA